MFNLLLVGPTCIGKRFTYVTLKEKFGAQIQNIETGQLARDQFEKDPDFKKEFLPFTLKGKLIPDSAILPLVEQRIGQIARMSEVVYRCFDGIPRCVSQLDFLVDDRRHISPDDTIAVVLHGTRATCRRRFDHRYKEKTNGKRVDEMGDYEELVKTFNDRYTLHQEEYPKVRAKLTKRGFKIHDVDANKDLEHFPLDVLAFAQAAWNIRSDKPIVQTPRPARMIIEGIRSRRTPILSPIIPAAPAQAATMAFGK